MMGQDIVHDLHVGNTAAFHYIKHDNEQYQTARYSGLMGRNTKNVGR